MVAISNRAERLAVQEEVDYLRASSQSLARQLQAMARISPRAPRDCEESTDYSLAVPIAEQHFRASARDDAQNAAHLDYVFAVADTPEADYPDPARI